MKSLVVSIYRPVAGWKWQLLSEDGPEYTSFNAFRTCAEAEEDGKAHAEAEGFAFKPYTGPDRDEIDSLDPIGKIQKALNIPDENVFHFTE